MSNIAHDLEEKIMDCWSVCEDINVVWEEHQDSKEPMSDDELANILLGMSQLYGRKFNRLQEAFEKICAHGGVWLSPEQVADFKKVEKNNTEIIQTGFIPKTVTRVELIDDTGRCYVKNDVKETFYQLQDKEQTLKVFVNLGDE